MKLQFFFGAFCPLKPIPNLPQFYHWTADKVIDAPDRFRIFPALEQDRMVGYLDVTHKYEENKPYDLFVTKAYCRDFPV